MAKRVKKSKPRGADRAEKSELDKTKRAGKEFGKKGLTNPFRSSRERKAARAARREGKKK